MSSLCEILEQGCARFADFCANSCTPLIAFPIALQWKCENMLGEKQPKFTETSTPQKYSQTPHV